MACIEKRRRLNDERFYQCRDHFKSQRRGRLATVGSDGQPHVVPVGFRFNPDDDAIEIGGHSGFAKGKYRDVVNNSRVAFVIDDVPSVNPWIVRGIEIRDQAEVLTTGGKELGPGFDPEMFRILDQNGSPVGGSTPRISRQ
jgi:pyridoxamine 5'-phosphate oxidase family protein